MTKNQYHGMLLAMLLVLGALAGCSGSTTDTASSTTTTTPLATTTSGTQSPTATTTTTTIQSSTTTATGPAIDTGTATATATDPQTETATPPLTPDSPIDGGTARQATITDVTDGDTVEVEFSNGETDTIRLIGVDTPETIASNLNPSEYGIPDTTQGRDWLLNWGDKASSFATEQLAGEQVLVVTDPESDKRGYYGRLLAYIYVDGTNFGKQLVQRGYARVYTGSEFVLEDEYLDLEATAQAADKGLWAFKEATTPTATPLPESTESPAEDGGVVTPTPSNDGELPDPYDCGDFETREQVEAVFDPDNDISNLDGNGDGVACESIA
jgi:micrococcal nuclease